ncbi:MAG: DUF5698 domain-containing protein [Sphaerochaetaceae bacterium]|jgi:uncharacterized protein YebE (UPF0316 family)|nr:DUF5698 domain-containing protein [Sphaerochaetaceae bacterium]MDD3163689.1 DUF5698 domain-containing protein [Sphaerochaetaceae bacterium]MDD4007898.1 DUF5698 domain-containing protein [Sphaerochaetaceae bacterium]MDD4397120.1 DUF5698 domain-containing protein [Sphaerochaetaceae bacterium]
MLEAISRILSGRFWWVYAIIFFGKLLEVALATLRTQLIVKGERILGALVAALEYMIWILITATVLADFTSDPIKIVVLTLAFSLGQIVGSYIEEALALGTCTINAVFSDRADADKAASLLREKGLALTIFDAEGIQSAPRTVIMMTLKRKLVEGAIKTIHKADPKAVISTAQSVSLEGGTMADSRKAARTGLFK